MPMIFKSVLWALCVITIALLAAFGVLPERVAQDATWLIPALAVSVLILPATRRRVQCGKSCA
ncbi:MAG: hypothetical protein AAFZ11_01880 [Pseudomonadota bacterium]